MYENTKWEDYKPKVRVGKLCYYLCSRRSNLPIRDVLNDHRKGNKEEPNIETSTYNWHRRCNQRSLRAAVRDGLSHILFITKYTGNKEEYRNRYFIVGYYEIGWTTRKKELTVIKANKLCFVPVDKAYEITNERWKDINPEGKPLRNLRHATQRITGYNLDAIIANIDKGDALNDFKQEVERLIPFKLDQKKNRNYRKSPHNC